MKYYVDLPEYFRQFVYHKSDISLLIDNTTDHTWSRYPVEDYITEQGIKWFSERNLRLYDVCNIFNAYQFSETSVHIDTIAKFQNDFALNFVLFGEGNMQWVDVDGDRNYYKLNSSVFYGYTNIKYVEVLAEWSGKMALVRVNIPHRIVTKNLRRICLSLRFYKTCSFEQFESLL